MMRSAVIGLVIEAISNFVSTVFGEFNSKFGLAESVFVYDLPALGYEDDAGV
jgi:hypothetical protein